MANGVTVTTRMLYDDAATYGPYAENSWHFSYNPLTILPPAPEQAAIAGRNAIMEFWQGTPLTDASYMQAYLSPLLTGEVQVRYVDWEDEDNISHEIEGFTLTPGPYALPTEVASCMTFKCDPYGGHRRQSFYNRVYLGPLSTAAAGSSSATGRPSSSFRDDAATAYTLFQDSLNDAFVDDVRHAVYSPTHDSSGLVTYAWMDNDWDTIRRRSLEPTSKTMFIID